MKNRKRTKLHDAVALLDKRYFVDWDKLSQRERDAWNLIVAHFFPVPR